MEVESEQVYFQDMKVSCTSKRPWGPFVQPDSADYVRIKFINVYRGYFSETMTVGPCIFKPGNALCILESGFSSINP